MVTVTERKFWTVQGPYAVALVRHVRHYDRPSATNEAKRLAHAHPGKVFMVMEAVYGYGRDIEIPPDQHSVNVSILD